MFVTDRFIQASTLDTSSRVSVITFSGSGGGGGGGSVVLQELTNKKD